MSSDIVSNDMCTVIAESIQSGISIVFDDNEDNCSNMTIEIKGSKTTFSILRTTTKIRNRNCNQHQNSYVCKVKVQSQRSYVYKIGT